jgi:hypothetical protein
MRGPAKIYYDQNGDIYIHIHLVGLLKTSSTGSQKNYAGQHAF